VPSQTFTNERGAPEEARDVVPDGEEDALRKLAVRRLEHIRKFKLYLTVYVLSMVVLVPVWIVTQYETSPGWLEHLSSRSRYPGDWDPWIIWVALIGAVVVAIAGVRAYLLRPSSQREIEREVERLKR
jgi:hypothetical protein